MEQEFELPVEHKGQQLMLKASLLVTGYTHKFSVEVDEQIIVFEPDEEGNYRGLIPYGEIANQKNVDVELLKIIAEVIEHLFK
ncbi:MAG TPA: hypothetical protein VMU83_19875 [Hanamia sp.]|nr:hypothetical protein [Hanamia sp.]